MLTKNATCFVWHEGLGKRGVNELGKCVYKYLEEVARNGEEKEIIFYSDNCLGEQKNRYVFACICMMYRTIYIHFQRTDL